MLGIGHQSVRTLPLVGCDTSPNYPLLSACPEGSPPQFLKNEKTHCSGARLAYCSRSTRVARGGRPKWRSPTHILCSACKARAWPGWSSPVCSSRQLERSMSAHISRSACPAIVAEAKLACTQLATTGMELAHAQLAVELTPRIARTPPAQCGDPTQPSSLDLSRPSPREQRSPRHRRTLQW